MQDRSGIEIKVEEVYQDAIYEAFFCWCYYCGWEYLEIILYWISEWKIFISLMSVSCCVWKCHTTRPLMTSASAPVVFLTQYSLPSPSSLLLLPSLQHIYMLHGSSTEEQFPLGYVASHCLIFLDASYPTGSIHSCLHNLHHLSFISNASMPLVIPCISIQYCLSDPVQ